MIEFLFKMKSPYLLETRFITHKLLMNLKLKFYKILKLSNNQNIDLLFFIRIK